MRTAVYARLSKRTDGNAPNLDDQLQRCREHAVKRGWSVVAEHTDYGESAYARDDMDDRPGYADLLADIRARSVDAVLAWRPDRLWRDPIEAAVMLRLCVTHDVKIVATVTEGDRDPNNPGDEMVTTIVATVGRYESAAKSARLRAKARQLAEAGRPTGYPPYGYSTPDRQAVDAGEAAVIREVVDRLLRGESATTIAVDLNARGLRTKKGYAWTRRKLTRMARSPYIAGLREHHGVVSAVGTWPGIIDQPTWTRLQQVMDRPQPRTGSPYVLSRGLTLCGPCGAPLVARPSGTTRKYVCSKESGGCGRIARVAESLEADVEARVWAAIDAGEVVDVEPEPPAGVTPADVNAAEAKLTELARDYYMDGAIGKKEYLALRQPLADEVERLRKAFGAAQQVPPPLTISDLQARWGSMTVAERHHALRSMIEAVVVHPAVKGRNTYDPSRVEVRWLR